MASPNIQGIQWSMSMGDHVYLAFRYLCRNKVTTAILVCSITLILSLPCALIVIVDDATEHFRSRAESVPLIIGARGSRLELVLGTLYFDDPAPGILPMSELERVERFGFGKAIPLHTGVRTAETAVIGTTGEYHRLRGLSLQSGRPLEIAGECVVGSGAAQRLELRPGDKLPVTSEKAFSLRDKPLRLHVTGIVSPTETPDDDVIFVNLKTIWIIEGRGHGHIKDAKHGTADAIEYTDITKENLDSFHFHGRESDFPITAVMIFPKDAKSRALLIGEYLSPYDKAQIVRSDEVMEGLLDKLLMVRSYVFAVIAILSTVTLSVIVLVIALSIRMRRRELLTMTKMGCSRFAVAGILGCQIAIILAASFLASVGTVALVSTFGDQIIRSMVF